MRRVGMRVRCGVTLAEVLVCISLMGVAMTMATVYFHQAMHLEFLEDQHHRHSRQCATFLREFGREVRAARGFAAQEGEYRSGESVLILRRDDGVTVLMAEGGRVDRIRIGKDGTERVTLLDLESYGDLKDQESPKGQEGPKSPNAPEVSKVSKVSKVPEDVSITFDFEGATAQDARAVVATVRWQEFHDSPVKDPVLSLRVAPRGR